MQNWRIYFILRSMKTVLTTLHSKFIHPSLALPCLAAYCRDTCGELPIREFTVHEPRDNILAALLDEHADVIAFSVYIWNRGETLALVDAIHIAAPHIRIILGGPETSYPEANIWEHHPGISAIIHGEGERPLRALLRAWQADTRPIDLRGLSLRTPDGIIAEPQALLLEHLDELPSPYALELMDCAKGFVYYESSRGCPYSCAFCMSALDTKVRSFSMQRIKQDLLMLMQQKVPKIKLVDRTFNYDPQRARAIFAFILEHNRSSHFHFEIGAHLLDAPTLRMLEQVPQRMFQFEIGVQSTMEDTLKAVRRHAPLEILLANVKHLLRRTHIHIHLDLIAGLPGDDITQILHGIDTLMHLRPHHLQIEPLKLLPGAPLRRDAAALKLHYDPNPPYTILRSDTLDFFALEHLRGISRLLDLTWNCGRAANFILELGRQHQSVASALAELERYWNKHGLLRFPLGQREIFEHLAAAVHSMFNTQPQVLELLQQTLARDLALREPITPAKTPDFFTFQLQDEEEYRVKERVKEKLEQIKGKGIKLQYFAARFPALALQHQSEESSAEKVVYLFIYLTQSGARMQVEELRL
ncbi:MAG: radical SAM protein [Desulfuromonadaceae bacterium]|nr:radical SAM protein [Desulfuromonadaceae bacterium]